jgi:hypothetical protein
MSKRVEQFFRPSIETATDTDRNGSIMPPADWTQRVAQSFLPSQSRWRRLLIFIGCWHLHGPNVIRLMERKLRFL